MWNALTDIVETTISELGVFMKKYPYTMSFEDWFGVDEFNESPEIRKAEHKAIAECARYFKAHPDQLERWSKLYNK